MAVIAKTMRTKIWEIDNGNLIKQYISYNLSNPEFDFDKPVISEIIKIFRLFHAQFNSIPIFTDLLEAAVCKLWTLVYEKLKSKSGIKTTHL